MTASNMTFVATEQIGEGLTLTAVWSRLQSATIGEIRTNQNPNVHAKSSLWHAWLRHTAATSRPMLRETGMFLRRADTLSMTAPISRTSSALQPSVLDSTFAGSVGTLSRSPAPPQRSRVTRWT